MPSLDDCTQYEGKDGFVLVDKAQYEATVAEAERLRSENAELRAGLERLERELAAYKRRFPACGYDPEEDDLLMSG